MCSLRASPHAARCGYLSQCCTLTSRDTDLVESGEELWVCADSPCSGESCGSSAAVHNVAPRSSVNMQENEDELRVQQPANGSLFQIRQKTWRRFSECRCYWNMLIGRSGSAGPPTVGWSCLFVGVLEKMQQCKILLDHRH